MKTIGLVGGMTWHSTLEYYRRINQEVAARLGPPHSARLLLWSVDFAEHLEGHERRGWDGVLEEIVEIGRRLRRAGADLLVLGANTVHRVADEVAVLVGLPVVHIADATGEAVRAAGLTKVGLLGTRHTMGDGFYQRRLERSFGVEIVTPAEPDFSALDRMIYHDLASGRFDDELRSRCRAMMDRLHRGGAEGVILACTELPILMAGADSPCPLFDTLDLHVAAAVDLALQSPGSVSQ